MIITIDGPTASGKSTVARELAKEFNYFYINSGLYFRAFAYLLVKAGISEQELVDIAHERIVKIVELDSIVYIYKDGVERIWYKKSDLTPFLKEEKIDQPSSVIATNGAMRAIVLTLVRQLAQNNNIVIDGRDTGAVVFPDADLKIFLTATEAVRAYRWRQVQASLNNPVNQETALAEIKQRDERDKNRKISPLRVPPHALVIDSSDLSIPQILEKIKKLIFKQ